MVKPWMSQSRRAQTGTAAPITTSHVVALEDIVYGGGSSHGGSGLWYKSTSDGGLVTTKPTGATGPFDISMGQGGHEGGETDVMGFRINIGDQNGVIVHPGCTSNAGTVGSGYIGIKASTYWTKNPTVEINAGCVNYLDCLDIAREPAVNIKSWHGGDSLNTDPATGEKVPGGNTVEISADSSHHPASGETHVSLTTFNQDWQDNETTMGRGRLHLSGKRRAPPVPEVTVDQLLTNSTQLQPMQGTADGIAAVGGWLQLGPIGPPAGSVPAPPKNLMTHTTVPGLICNAAGQVILSADTSKPPGTDGGSGGGVELRMGGPGQVAAQGLTGPLAGAGFEPGDGCAVFDYTGRAVEGAGEIWIKDLSSNPPTGFPTRYARITFEGATGPGDQAGWYHFNNSNNGGGKTFIIPHPLDNLRDSTELLHSCIEAPTVDNIYRGSCRLMNGKGIVNLDSNDRYQMTQGTFQALNKDLQVHVTNNENFDRVKGEIIRNELHIICENPDSDANVAWLVIGTRHDPSIRECPKTNDAGDLITERPRN